MFLRDQHQGLRSAVLAAAAAVCVLGTTGCGMGKISSPSALSGQEFNGVIMGGGQPVSGANIQLYTPSTSGYAATAATLFNRTVTSDANGHFNFTGAYTCPSASTPVYLVITGGNPGLPAGTNNSALALMGLLGNCGDMTASSSFVINELTTVAAVWALAPFMTDYAHIGTSPANAQGLANAFTTAQALVDIHTGKTPGVAANIATVPSAEIGTLGAILASCVNSNGSTAASAGCGRLFTAATPSGGSTPTNTITAALDIARNPGHNVGTLFSAFSPTGTYQPLLTIAPPDWTLAINYVSPAFTLPSDLAIDSQGNAWVLSMGSGDANSSTVSILNTGGLLATFPQQGVTYNRMALDPYDEPWVTSTLYSNVSELSSSGTRVGNPFTGGGVQGPGPMAFDGYGNLWTLNNGPTASKLSANGAALSPGAGFSLGDSSAATALALDTSGNAWIADSNSNTVIVLDNNGAQIPGSPYSGAGITDPFAVAVDSTGGAWVANRTGHSLSRLTSNGTAVFGSPYFGAGLSSPIDLAVDGLGSVWLVNSGTSSVSEFLSTGRAQSGGSGYGSAAMANPVRVAIDKSGNVWVANLGTSTAGTGMITEIVGAAAPVVTPASVAIQNNALNQRP
ncbi:NHL repeat-containing protein [Edaphobacter aggregans]|uniref:NHL repeat-containing protein n=1 Tax=Edaphobacter aggregans TaxID=570835 RepID=UPI0005500B9C|nr:NHL repeat-containing protein [Edaphobacter aggregans]